MNPDGYYSWCAKSDMRIERMRRDIHDFTASDFEIVTLLVRNGKTASEAIAVVGEMLNRHLTD